MVAFDDESRRVRLSLRQADILKALAEDEALCKQGGCVPDLQSVKRYACSGCIYYGARLMGLSSHQGESIPVFHPEFGRYMLEATPGKPWGIGFKDLLDVEPNMRWRYVAMSALQKDQ